jgi:glutathione S-transferase
LEHGIIGEDKQVATAAATPPLLVLDSVVDPTPPHEWSQHNDRPTLFREREGWCPYSERVWLALEVCRVPYDTVRIDNSGYGPRPFYFNGQTPQIQWPGGSDSAKNQPARQGESTDLVQRIFKDYGNNPAVLVANQERHDACICMWSEIMPQRSRPSSRAAFLFQSNGEPLGESQLRKTLRGVDAMMNLYSSRGDHGPLLTGDTVGPADVFWAPFLERYRYQLPCLYDGLDPNDATEYPHLARWYSALDESVAAYSCRVKGNAASWRKVLKMAGFGNAGVPPIIQANMDQLIAKEIDESRRAMAYGPALWREYAKGRPYLAQKSPSDQAALTIVQNHDAICADAFRRCGGTDKNRSTLPELEADMKSLVMALMTDATGAGAAATAASNNVFPASRTVKQLAMFLTERMCVPRDMGCLPAAAIHVLSLD